MVFSTVVLYFYVKNLLLSEVEEELFSIKARVETALTSDSKLFNLSPVLEINNVDVLGTEILKDTIIFDPSQNEMEEFRALTSFKEINGVKYRITVRNLIVESDDILIAILLSYTAILLFVFIFLFYFNKAQNKKIWLPFFKNLEAMKKFSLTSSKTISLIDSDVIEFSELNAEILLLTNKVRSDYENLKLYTEDVSHELQTPLAIIQAKIENIINGDDLNNVQFEHLTSIQKDIQRLVQINKRLTLLTKIENNQFLNLGKINMKDKVEHTIKNFQELSNTKIEFINNNDVWVNMDPYLAEVLCNNLISNAIKHSAQNGNIEIRLKNEMFLISNTGRKPLEHPENLYSRFYRESNTVKSTGLGLAIVKSICELYNFKIDYSFNESKHNFTITFK